MLLRVAVCCSAVKCVAKGVDNTQKSARYEIAVCCRVLPCVAVCCSVLQCVVQCGAVCCSVMRKM